MSKELEQKAREIALNWGISPHQVPEYKDVDCLRDWLYEAALEALQLNQKEIAFLQEKLDTHSRMYAQENEALQERIKELESDNKIRVGDYVIYRDFPNAGWSQVLSIQMDMPSIEPLAHLVDEYGNTGTEPLRRLVKSNSPHLFAEKPNNRTAEKPKFGIPTTEEKRDIGHNDPDRGDDYDC